VAGVVRDPAREQAAAAAAPVRREEARGAVGEADQAADAVAGGLPQEGGAPGIGAPVVGAGRRQEGPGGAWAGRDADPAAADVVAVVREAEAGPAVEEELGDPGPGGG